MDSDCRGFVNDVEYSFGPHVESKWVTRGRPREGYRATEIGRDWAMNVARQDTNHLWMLREEFSKLQATTKQSFGRSTRHAAVKRRVMQSDNGRLITGIIQAVAQPAESGRA